MTDSLIEFPCDFPLKIMGANAPDFAQAIADVVHIHAPDFDAATYRRRNVVERLIGWLKQFRRIATRYEKRASNYLAMLTLAAVRIWMR